MNVGVHVGPAIVGTLLGEPPTMTAIGDTVNVANRIEQANKQFGTRLLVSDAVHAEAGEAVRIGRSFSCLAARQGRRAPTVRGARPRRRSLNR